MALLLSNLCLYNNTFDSKGIPLVVSGVTTFGENVPTILSPVQTSFAVKNNLDMFKHLKRNKKSLKIMGVKRKPVSLTKFKRGCLIRMVLLLFSYCISNKVTERILGLSCKTRFRRSSFSRIFRECVCSISPCSNKATKKIKVQICLP